MDSQKTNDESLPQSEKELQINIIDLMVSDDTETKQPSNGQTIHTPEEEEEKENTNRNLKYKPNVEEEKNENENFEKLEQNKTENTNEKRVINGVFTDDSAGKSLELLWAEAIKAQNEGRYKDAIRNFTEIYENMHSTPELKHKTKCRLVFALYQDNQADEAEKIGWESEIVPAAEDKKESNTKIISSDKSCDTNKTSGVCSKVDSGKVDSSSKTAVSGEPTRTASGIKPDTPISAPDEDESTITRISECSDDANLIKLDLSQLVGEPTASSDDKKEAASIKSAVKRGEQTSPDQVIASEETNEAIVIDVRNDESEVTVRITSIPTPVSE